jgi:hypothetical protein
LHNIANLNVIFEKSRDMCVAQQRWNELFELCL